MPSPLLLFEEEEWGSDAHDTADVPSNSESKLEVAEYVRNWKAAQSDNKKRVMDMFDEIGWFACRCRHSIIFWVADMVQMGEQ